MTVLRSAAILFSAWCVSAAAAQGRVDGQIVDVLGEPISLATVQVSMPGMPARTVTTDAQGRFAVADLRLHVPVRLLATAPGRAAGRSEIALDERLPQVFERLCLLDAAPVQGRVVDKAGAPVAGALVMPAQQEGRSWLGPGHVEPEPQHAVTDVDGRYRFAALPLGPLRLAAVARGHALAIGPAFRLDGPCEGDLQLQACATATYRITVDGLDERQWSSLEVQPCLDTDEDLPIVLWWPPAREGKRLVFADWPLGLVRQFELRVAGVVLADDILGVGDGGGVQDLATRAVERTERLRGSLVDPGGKPLVGCRVVDSMDDRFFAAAISGKDGAFLLPVAPGSGRRWLRLDDARYVLHCDHDDPAFAVRHSDTCFAVLAEAPIALVADHAARVKGKIVDHDGNAAGDACARLVARVSDNTFPAGTQQLFQMFAGTRCRADGSFVMEGLDGHFGLALWLWVESSHGFCSRAVIRIEPGRTLDLGTIRLQDAAVIEGSLVRSGRPRPGVEVVARMIGTCTVVDDLLGTWKCCSDRSGRFRLALPAGEYTICADDDEGSSELARLRLVAGQKRTLAPR